MFFMKKNKEIELHNLKYEELKNLNQIYIQTSGKNSFKFSKKN